MDKRYQERSRRLLFCSYHCYCDPSSGAALATRDLLELLTSRGWQCRVLCGPQLDFEQSLPLQQLLRSHQSPFEERLCTVSSFPFSVLHLVQEGVSVTLYAPAEPTRYPPPPEEGYPFLGLVERYLAKWRPDVVLTYGGHRLARQIMRLVRRSETLLVFALHNLAYDQAEFFQPVNAVLVPSRFAQGYYRDKLGLSCTAIPGPWNWARVRCPDVLRRYVTFVNPQPEKGVFVFVRIATELGRLRPDIPLLVVEGRGKADWLGRTGHELRGLKNLHVMANTPDPRHFYRVSRLVLMPSLVRESFPRVAAEALINGIPVLGSNRGGLPEVLEQAGFLFDIPGCYTPDSRTVPTTGEVAPWVQAITHLWDDEAAYERERERSWAAALAWTPERLGPRFDGFFTSVNEPSLGSRENEQAQ